MSPRGWRAPATCPSYIHASSVFIIWKGLEAQKVKPTHQRHRERQTINQVGQEFLTRLKGSLSTTFKWPHSSQGVPVREPTCIYKYRGIDNGFQCQRPPGYRKAPLPSLLFSGDWRSPWRSKHNELHSADIRIGLKNFIQMMFQSWTFQ